MKPAIDVIGTDKCASCFACYNACPENAIKMQLDEEGFYKPIVNYDRCTNCGICSNKCPIINFNSDNNPKPIYYAVWSKDNSIRFSSSSGGVFSELASFILKQKGVVYGVAWDKNFYVKHIRIDSEEGLSLLRGSKYIQSYVGKIYKDVLNNLKKGKKVLFSGTPCQVAALKKLLVMIIIYIQQTWYVMVFLQLKFLKNIWIIYQMGIKSKR